MNKKQKLAKRKQKKSRLRLKAKQAALTTCNRNGLNFKLLHGVYQSSSEYKQIRQTTARAFLLPFFLSSPSTQEETAGCSLQ